MLGGPENFHVLFEQHSFSVLQYSDLHIGAVHKAIALIKFYIMPMIYNKRLLFISRFMDYLVYSFRQAWGL